MSAISRAMAAPSLTAIPTSAAESAGESLMPSPSMMTVRPLRALFLHEVCLILRQNLGAVLVHAHLCRNGGGGALAVAGQHDGFAHAQFPQRLDRPRPPHSRRGSADTDDCGQLSANGQIEVADTAAEARRTLPAPLRGSRDVLILKDKVGTSDDDLLALHSAGDAVGHQILHLGVHLLVGQVPGPVPPAPRRWPWSGGSAPPGRQPGAASPSALRPPKGTTRSTTGAGMGQGAGLIEHDGIRLCHAPPGTCRP